MHYHVVVYSAFIKSTLFRDLPDDDGAFFCNINEPYMVQISELFVETGILSIEQEF
jgi:hypothetical protein